MPTARAAASLALLRYTRSLLAIFFAEGSISDFLKFFVENSRFLQQSESILELDKMLDRLGSLARSCGCPAPEHQNWYALLKGKLIPQLAEKPILIVAVMGGTNTGKSLVFNHLVGEQVSAVDHRASGTKHPVCLVSNALEAEKCETILARHFETFALVRRLDADQPLRESDTHQLFWDRASNIADNLIVLDTPDIDSDRMVNWDRAKAIRNAADVLIAVLTEQKYNDAAVRRFFREANGAGKPVIVLFNMIDFSSDAAHLPNWLERFSMETGIRPIAVLASPFDRAGAEKLDLPFHEYQMGGTFGEKRELSPLLSELHFDAIKSHTLLGALKVLSDPATGLPSYLDSVERSSQRFAEALETLERAGETSVPWPGLPTSILVEEIRDWWNAGRPGWSKKINGVYRKVGNGLLWPIRKATKHISTQYFGAMPALLDSLQDFRNREDQAAIFFVEAIIKRLEKLAETDNPVLRREILDLIGGERRAALMQRAHDVLDALTPVDDDFRCSLRNHLDSWAERNPQAVNWVRSLDHITTVARPVVTVSLFWSGLAVGGVSWAVSEFAFAGGITAGGEAAIHAGTEGAKHGSAKLFQKIQEDYVLARSKQFFDKFQHDLWQDVIERLRVGANLTHSEVFQACRTWRVTE